MPSRPPASRRRSALRCRTGTSRSWPPTSGPTRPCTPSSAGAGTSATATRPRQRGGRPTSLVEMRDELKTRFVEIHGHRVAYRAAGEGPAIVLVHGIAGSSSTYTKIMPTLAQTHTVIAPDLLGHGESAKPRGDYSLGAYGCGIRDLLAVL